MTIAALDAAELGIIHAAGSLADATRVRRMAPAADEAGHIRVHIPSKASGQQRIQTRKRPRASTGVLQCFVPLRSWTVASQQSAYYVMRQHRPEGRNQAL